METFFFSCKQSLHTLSFCANSFTCLTTSHLILKLMFVFCCYVVVVVVVVVAVVVFYSN